MKAPRFSKKTFDFIEKAAKQKRVDWLDKNRDEYESCLQKPLQHLAGHLHEKISPSAAGYHFPLKGIGRIKRSAGRVSDSGSVFKDWISYSASVPSKSRFDHNPNLFFMINPFDEEGDQVLVAGGLYMPSSVQLRAIRQAIATNSAPFEKLFSSKAFRECFKDGFSNERISSRIPRGFDPKHPMMKWIQLQAFFVWRPYTKKEFFSTDFAKIVARDWKQVLRLNQLLDQAIRGNGARFETLPSIPLSNVSVIDDVAPVSRKLDF